MSERCDAVVLGLGAMGAATVYQLAKAGVNVVGIDRHHPPHNLGSSHGDTRITRLSVGEGAQYVPIVRNSHRIWRELEALSGASLFEQSGLLVLTSSPLTQQTGEGVQPLRGPPSPNHPCRVEKMAGICSCL
jgi:sarcosine oxidase